MSRSDEAAAQLAAMGSEEEEQYDDYIVRASFCGHRPAMLPNEYFQAIAAYRDLASLDQNDPEVQHRILWLERQLVL